MERRTLACVLGAVAIATSLPALSRADTITLRRNDVVQVVFEDEINLKENHRGDHFSVRVKDDRDLPEGTRLIGRIADIQKQRDKRPAYADLEFIAIESPDGTRSDIRAVPIAIDKNMRRNRDGRFQGPEKPVRKQDMVIGGTVGGLVLGALFKKPFEGAMIGAIAGIVLAETNALNTDGDVLVKRGATMGAMFERDATIDLGRYGDRYDYRDRDGRYDDRRDDRYDRRDDRWNDRYEDRDRYGRDIRIEFDGREMRFSGNESPYRVGDTMMVPLERTARQMGLDVDKSGDRVFFVEDDNSSLKIEQDSENYRLNGRRGTLSRPAIEKNGILFVPIDVLAAMKQGRVKVNANKL